MSDRAQGGKFEGPGQIGSGCAVLRTVSGKRMSRGKERKGRKVSGSQSLGHTRADVLRLQVQESVECVLQVPLALQGFVNSVFDFSPVVEKTRPNQISIDKLSPSRLKGPPSCLVPINLGRLSNT